VQGRVEEAVEHYYGALRIKPKHEGAHNNLGFTFAIHGQWDKASNHYAQALAIAPGNIATRFNMGIAQLALGDPTNALGNLRYAVKHRSQDALTHKALGDVLLQLKDPSEALKSYRKALALDPDHAEALDRVAWILATSTDAALRNGKEAVQLAEHACQLTKYQQPIMLITLATACAETGDFKRAVDMARKAETLAIQQGDRFVSERARQLGQEFEQNQPHREP
jgi:Tfp pilus assembly protein PilF